MYWANLLHIYQPPGQKREIIDEVALESYGRILDVLEKHQGTEISINICASLTEQLHESGHEDIVTRIRMLAEAGRIELVSSAAYHPILPFLPEKEIIRQIRLNEEINRKYFGSAWQPRGFFLPEMAYSRKAAEVIKSMGYQWIVLDEIAYKGRIGGAAFDKKYRLKISLFRHLGVIFRNRGLSATFFSDWLDAADKFFSAAQKDGRCDKFAVTAFDGENLGHHQSHLIDVWEKIITDPRVVPVGYSQYLGLLRKSKTEKVEPVNSSWATEQEDFTNGNFYPLWSDPYNLIHEGFRKLAVLARKSVYRSVKEENYAAARKILDKAMFSDPCWWASARPWWGPGMIILGVRCFSKIFALLEMSMDPREREEAKSLSEMILSAVKTKEIKKNNHLQFSNEI